MKTLVEVAADYISNQSDRTTDPEILNESKVFSPRVGEFSTPPQTRFSPRVGEFSTPPQTRGGKYKGIDTHTSPQTNTAPTPIRSNVNNEIVKHDTPKGHTVVSSRGKQTTVTKHPLKTAAHIVDKAFGSTKYENYEEYDGDLDILDETNQNISKLAGSEDKHKRALAAQHPKTPSHVLSKLSRDSEGVVRHSVAQHPSTPSHILDALRKDKDLQVRSAAQKRVNNG